MERACAVLFLLLAGPTLAIPAPQLAEQILEQTSQDSLLAKAMEGVEKPEIHTEIQRSFTHDETKSENTPSNKLTKAAAALPSGLSLAATKSTTKPKDRLGAITAQLQQLSESMRGRSQQPGGSKRLSKLDAFSDRVISLVNNDTFWKAEERGSKRTSELKSWFEGSVNKQASDLDNLHQAGKDMMQDLEANKGQIEDLEKKIVAEKKKAEQAFDKSMKDAANLKSVLEGRKDTNEVQQLIRTTMLHINGVYSRKDLLKSRAEQAENELRAGLESVGSAGANVSEAQEKLATLNKRIQPHDSSLSRVDEAYEIGKANFTDPVATAQQTAAKQMIQVRSEIELAEANGRVYDAHQYMVKSNELLANLGFKHLNVTFPAQAAKIEAEMDAVWEKLEDLYEQGLPDDTSKEEVVKLAAQVDAATKKLMNLTETVEQRRGDTRYAVDLSNMAKELLPKALADIDLVKEGLDKLEKAAEEALAKKKEAEATPEPPQPTPTAEDIQKAKDDKCRGEWACDIEERRIMDKAAEIAPIKPQETWVTGYGPGTKLGDKEAEEARAKLEKAEEWAVTTGREVSQLEAQRSQLTDNLDHLKGQLFAAETAYQEAVHQWDQKVTQLAKDNINVNETMRNDELGFVTDAVRHQDDSNSMAYTAEDMRGATKDKMTGLQSQVSEVEEKLKQVSAAIAEKEKEAHNSVMAADSAKNALNQHEQSTKEMSSSLGTRDQAQGGAVTNSSANNGAANNGEGQACEDNSNWHDSQKPSSSCQNWAGFDCNVQYDGFSGPSEVTQNCKKTCGLCGGGDGLARVQGDSETQKALKQKADKDVEQANAACEDNSNWHDSQKPSSSCQNWAGFDCNVQYDGFSGPSEVTQHCKKTCGLCGGGGEGQRVAENSDVQASLKKKADEDREKNSGSESTESDTLTPKKHEEEVAQKAVNAATSKEKEEEERKQKAEKEKQREKEQKEQEQQQQEKTAAEKEKAEEAEKAKQASEKAEKELHSQIDTVVGEKKKTDQDAKDTAKDKEYQQKLQVFREKKSKDSKKDQATGTDNKDAQDKSDKKGDAKDGAKDGDAKKAPTDKPKPGDKSYQVTKEQLEKKLEDTANTVRKAQEYKKRVQSAERQLTDVKAEIRKKEEKVQQQQQQQQQQEKGQQQQQQHIDADAVTSIHLGVAALGAVKYQLAGVCGIGGLVLWYSTKHFR